MSPAVQTVVLDVEGMKCGGCVRAVERTLLDQPGVRRADVNLVSRAAWLDLADSEGSVEAVLGALASRGFPARERSDELAVGVASPAGASALSWWQQWRQLMVALGLLVLSVLGHISEAGHLELPLIGSLPFHAALATVALLGPGRPILSGGIAAARANAPSMDTLVGLGVGSAYLASLVALIWPQVGWPCFFNEPVMLLGFVLLGRFLEERARFRTGLALQQLAQLQPETARLVLPDGAIREVRVGALRPGERLQLLAGDRVPVDGVVVEGESAVDASSLTGEPLPWQAEPGSELSSGSLNLEAPLVIEVTRVGAETALARIIRMVEQAQARRAPIQGLADRVAGRFCYGVMALAVGTFLFWWLFGAVHWPQVLHATSPGMPQGHPMSSSHAMHHGGLGSAATTPIGLALQLAIAVLVVACPCALGLATPTVITVATGLAARRGWLFRGGDVIETAAGVDRIVFDKTGTLTLGEPVPDLAQVPVHALPAALALAQSSHHPLSRALARILAAQELMPAETSVPEEIAGEGVFASWEGKRISLTRPLTDGASTATELRIGDDRWTIPFHDALRPDARETVARVAAVGLESRILSGDRNAVVSSVAENLGITGLGRVSPQDKLAELERLKAGGRRPLMVGDGLNDGPALAAAHVSIAPSTASDVSQQTADAVFIGERLMPVALAVVAARRTMRIVRQNFGFAIAYNVLAIPLALLGFVTPLVAAVAMSLSSLVVVANSLRLVRAAQ